MKIMTFYEWRYASIKKIDPLVLRSIQCHEPKLVWVTPECVIEKNVTLYPMVHIRGKSRIGENTTIDSGSLITDSVICANCHVHPYTIVENSFIDENCELGPHTLIQQTSRIGKGSLIGFTAQVKQSVLGNRTRAKHHCYIGNTAAGDEVNFGAGSITGNYDGVHKKNTQIGDDTFIGINVNVVAPITIGEEVFIAAGSTITGKISIPPHSFVIARAPAHISENMYSLSTEKGYEYVSIGKERLEKLQAFFGEEFPYWLQERNARFSNKSPLDVFRKNSEEFDRIVEGILHSCCT